jgi:hypothetical protein
VQRFIKIEIGLQHNWERVVLLNSGLKQDPQAISARLASMLFKDSPFSRPCLAPLRDLSTLPRLPFWQVLSMLLFFGSTSLGLRHLLEERNF